VDIDTDPWPCAEVTAHHLSAGSGRVHYLEGGSGPVCILLHGLGNSSLVWRRVVPQMAREMRVVVPDLPGAGHSDPVSSRPLLRAYAQVVESLCDHVAPDEQVAIVGNSVGGAVAMRVALDRPERVSRLVLVDPAGVGHGVPMWWRLAHVEPAVRLAFGPALALTPRPVLARVIGTAYRRMAFHDPDAVSDRTVRLFSEQLSSRERISRFLRSAHDIVDSFVPEVQRPARPIPVPVLAVWGRYDRLVPLSDALALLERLGVAELRIVENAGHSPQLERPVEFLDAVMGFLRGSGTPHDPGVTRLGLTHPRDANGDAPPVRAGTGRAAPSAGRGARGRPRPSAGAG
jgi:pimeloyl-ACP methyl ester carboxylesterase